MSDVELKKDSLCLDRVRSLWFMTRQACMEYILKIFEKCLHAECIFWKHVETYLLHVVTFSHKITFLARTPANVTLCETLSHKITF